MGLALLSVHDRNLHLSSLAHRRVSHNQGPVPASPLTVGLLRKEISNHLVPVTARQDLTAV